MEEKSPRDPYYAREVMAEWGRVLNAVQESLTYGEFVTYAILAGLDDGGTSGMTLRQVERLVPQRDSNLSRLIRDLIKAGWAISYRSGEDGRKVVYDITAEGRNEMRRLKDSIAGYTGPVPTGE